MNIRPTYRVKIAAFDGCESNEMSDVQDTLYVKADSGEQAKLLAKETFEDRHGVYDGYGFSIDRVTG